MMPTASPRPVASGAPHAPRGSLAAPLALVAGTLALLLACGPIHRVSVGEVGRLQPRLTLAEAADRLHARPLTSTDVRHAGKRWHVQFYSMDDGAPSPLLLVVFDRTGLRFWDHANAFAAPATGGSDRDAIAREALAWYRDWRRTNADVRAPTIEGRSGQE